MGFLSVSEWVPFCLICVYAISREFAVLQLDWEQLCFPSSPLAKLPTKRLARSPEEEPKEDSEPPIAIAGMMKNAFLKNS